MTVTIELPENLARITHGIIHEELKRARREKEYEDEETPEEVLEEIRYMARMLEPKYASICLRLEEAYQEQVGMRISTNGDLVTDEESNP